MLVARVQASSPMRRRVVGYGAWHDKRRQESQRFTVGFACLIGFQATMGKTRRLCMGGRVISWALENHVHVVPTRFTTTTAWQCACNGAGLFPRE